MDRGVPLGEGARGRGLDNQSHGLPSRTCKALSQAPEAAEGHSAKLLLKRSGS